MGKLEEFSINLDPSQLVYYPGERITGVVTIDLNDAMDMKCLKIKFIGTAFCHWKENNVKYNSKETIIQKDTCLFGNLKSTTSQKYSHPPGKYSYQFTFTLSNELPSSFEDIPGGSESLPSGGENYGYIRYMLKAKIKKPWKFDYLVKHPIIVNEYIDTNLSQHIHGPGNELHEKNSSWCSCFGKKSQPNLELTASIDRACYCPGEPILINAHVRNKTSSHFNSLTAEIRQHIRYRASGRTKTFESKLDDLKGPKILKGSSLSWQNLPLFIPPSPPTITNCKILSIKYEIRFQVNLSSGKEKSIILPLLIGTVPRRTQYGKFVRHYKTIPPAGCINDIKFPVPIPNIFYTDDNLNISYGETPREVVYGYCKSIKDVEVDISDKDDKYTWGQLCYTPLYTFVKISREIPIEDESPSKPCDPKHLVNITI